MSEITLRGSCLCGAVRYEARGEATRFYHCHCSRCRKATGSGHASNLFLQPGTLTWLSGEDLIVSFKPPQAKRFTNSFCSLCGSRVPRASKEPAFVLIPAGSLDEEPPIQPQARIFFGSRALWSCSGDGIPAFEEYVP